MKNMVFTDNLCRSEKNGKKLANALHELLRLLRITVNRVVLANRLDLLTGDNGSSWVKIPHPSNQTRPIGDLST